MELRDHIAVETTAFAERLIATLDAARERARVEADEAIARLRGEIEEIQAHLETERSRAAALAQQLDVQTTTNASLVAERDAATARLEALSAQVDAGQARISTLSTQLEAEAARASALAAKLEAESSRSTTLAAQLESESARNASIAAELHEEAARSAAVAAELEGTAAALRAAEQRRGTAEISLESATNEIRSVREMLESARAEAIRTSEALDAEAAQKALLQQEHETTVANLLAQLDASARAAKTLEEALANAERSAARTAEASAGRVSELQQQIDEQAERLRTNDVRVESAEAAAARVRDELAEAQAITDATAGEMTVLKGRLGRVTSVLAAAATSLEAMASARTVADVFASLVRELATEFARAAIFRVKGTHLEGDLAVGVDDSVDVQKIVVPLGMSSVLTKAAGSPGVQHATKEEIGDARPPFGGSPDLVVAAPLMFDGEVLAVAYADSDATVSEAHVSFATVLVRHANAVLAGLAQELRTSRQLRDYARTLLREVEMMFDADCAAGVPETAAFERLHANVGFARDLYAQRAALEGPLPANLLDEEIGRMMRGVEPSTPFSLALAAVSETRGGSRKVAAQ